MRLLRELNSAAFVNVTEEELVHGEAA